jgi:hypothetical protein
MLVARKINNGPGMIKAQGRIIILAWAFVVERVTRIELALSAWEADVLPLNYTRETADRAPRSPAGSFQPRSDTTCYRNR